MTPNNKLPVHDKDERMYGLTGLEKDKSPKRRKGKGKRSKAGDGGWFSSGVYVPVHLGTVGC